MENLIYLTIDQDRIWNACVSAEKPDERAVPFVVEQDYPVKMYFERTDLNGSRIVECEDCKSREDLLALLNWCGNCGYTILNLWDFDLDRDDLNEHEAAAYEKVAEIFDAGYKRKAEILEKEMDALTASFEPSAKVNKDTDGLSVDGHIGTWHTIEQETINGADYFLMEHDTYGDSAACIIVNAQGDLVMDDIWDGFDEVVMEELQDRAPTCTAKAIEGHECDLAQMIQTAQERKADIAKERPAAERDISR